MDRRIWLLASLLAIPLDAMARYKRGRGGLAGLVVVGAVLAIIGVLSFLPEDLRSDQRLRPIIGGVLIGTIFGVLVSQVVVAAQLLSSRGAAVAGVAAFAVVSLGAVAFVVHRGPRPPGA